MKLRADHDGSPFFDLVIHRGRIRFTTSSAKLTLIQPINLKLSGKVIPDRIYRSALSEYGSMFDENDVEKTGIPRPRYADIYQGNERPPQRSETRCPIRGLPGILFDSSNDWLKSRNVVTTWLRRLSRARLCSYRERDSASFLCRSARVLSRTRLLL